MPGVVMGVVALADPQVGPQIEGLLGTLREAHPGIQRMAVALYDNGTDQLRTFAHSTVGESPLDHYDARLQDMPGLRALGERGGARVLDDLPVQYSQITVHGRLLLEKGYRSSLTVPFYESGQLRGFLFYDASQKGFFTPSLVHHLEVYSRLATLLVLDALATARVLRAAVRMASHIGTVRDQETGAHLARMSRYAKVIASAMADSRGLSDEWIEFVFLFAPLHDIGKIGIPDSVLLKPGPLEPEELALMRTHVGKGVELVEALALEFGVAGLPQISILRNIVHGHHELMDGTGYPRGLAGEAIPLEARIVTVADVFDGLTSARPYKPAWTEEATLEFLGSQVGTRFDPACVQAVNQELVRIHAIQACFQQDREEAGTHEAYLPEL